VSDLCIIALVSDMYWKYHVKVNGVIYSLILPCSWSITYEISLAAMYGEHYCLCSCCCQRLDAGDIDGASTAKELGHFEPRGQNILEPGHPNALFSSKKLMIFFMSSPSKKGRQSRWDCFTQNRTNIAVRYGKKFFSVHTTCITKAKQ